MQDPPGRDHGTADGPRPLRHHRGVPLLVLLVALLAAIPATGAELAGRASITDGDTIEIHGQRIRLFGIDAPESRQLCQADGATYRCGQQAALALSDEIGS